MSTPAAAELREALAYCEDRTEGRIVRNEWQEVLAAARLLVLILEQGEEMDVCEVHGQTARPNAPNCIMESYLRALGATMADPCEIVPSLRIPLSVLRIADPGEEG